MMTNCNLFVLTTLFLHYLCACVSALEKTMSVYTKRYTNKLIIIIIITPEVGKASLGVGFHNQGESISRYS